ncbi:MAG TPA: DinB family protein [Tepidisphaeraceae bacterium]|nr:DinB family protein [Tepidisphaeraceae bacterium]
MTIAQLMIPELSREAETTRRLLARIPADKLDFTPGHGLHTIGWNASHLVEIVGWVPGIVNEPGLDLAAVDAEQQAAPTGDVAAMLARFDSNLAGSLAALEGVSDETMAQSWTMRMGQHEIFTMAKGDCLRKWVFTHTAHHRGILSATLRLAGVSHGSIYEE